MVAIPKPEANPKYVDHQFWNRYFVLEMADFTAIQIRGRCANNIGPELTSIGLKPIHQRKRDSPV